MEWSCTSFDAGQLAAARRELLEYLSRHSPDGTELRLAELAFDELVGNACEHAPGPVWINLDWSEVRPVLRVRDAGPGFSLADALSGIERRGLRILSELSGPVQAASGRTHGADVSVVLPLERRRSDLPPVAAATAGLPTPDEVRADGTVPREAFLRAVAVQIAQTVEHTHGPAAAQAAVDMVAQQIGGRIESEWRAAHDVADRPLTHAELATLLVQLKAAIGGRFRVDSVDGERIVLVNARCPFGEAVRQAPSLCRMTAGVFGGIAARNTSGGEVRLEERIAVGDERCRVVVSLRTRSSAPERPQVPHPRPSRTTAVLAEDAAFLRAPLVRMLQDAGVDVVAQADTPRELLQQVRTYRPEVAVVDFAEDATADALSVATDIRRAHPRTGVLVLAEQVEAVRTRDLVATGGTGIGYLLKTRLRDVDTFIDAVRKVANGGTTLDARVAAQLAGPPPDSRLFALTPRELEVLRLMADGMSNDTIADTLVVTKRAVEKHVTNIFQKLDLRPSSDHERRVLAVLAYRDGASGAGRPA